MAFQAMQCLETMELDGMVHMGSLLSQLHHACSLRCVIIAGLPWDAFRMDSRATSGLEGQLRALVAALPLLRVRLLCLLEVRDSILSERARLADPEARKTVWSMPHGLRSNRLHALLKVARVEIEFPDSAAAHAQA